MTTETHPTRLKGYIKETLPWLHGHQLKGIATFVEAIIERQTGNQAELARTQGNQEAAVKRLSRLLHNERLEVAEFPKWLSRQVLNTLPSKGKIRVTLDWTIEDDQHLLVVSVVIGRRALPIFWRAYQQSVLKGRMKMYELAIIKRAFKLIFAQVDASRIYLSADRGFADEGLLELLESLGIRYVIRVKGCTKVEFGGAWIKLNQVRFDRNSRRRNLGWIRYCQSKPHTVSVTMSRTRNKKGQWGIWCLVSNVRLSAKQAANEYGFRFCCEEGFRDAKWYLGFAEARIADTQAWSRLFALFALALCALTALGMAILICGGETARLLLRRVASRRSNRCELGLIAAVLALLQRDKSLFDSLSVTTRFRLDASLANVS
jgi:hypothetical protein